MDKPPAPMGPCFRRYSMGGNHFLLHLAGRQVRRTRRAESERLRRQRATTKACLDGPQRRLLCRRETEATKRAARETALVPLGSGLDLADRYFAVCSRVLPRANTC